MPRETRRDGLKWGEGTISERPNAGGTIRYRAKWLDHDALGQSVERSKTFATRDEAEDHLRSVIRAKRTGRYTSPSKLTVGELVAEFITRAHDAGRIADRTALTYRKRAATMIDPTLGKRRVETLTPLEVQRWIDGLGKHGFKPSTIHAAVAVLMGALREAALLGITDRHLGQGIRRPSLGQLESTTWSAPDVKRVLAAVAGDELWSALYHVAIGTGMRPGELRGLKWDCVDLERGLVTVRRTITKDVDGHEVIADRTKSKQARTVALAPQFVEVLRWHRIRQHERRLAHASWHQTDVVFDRGDGQFVNLSSWQRFHRALCERAGVPQIRAHDLRHTYATILMERNVHPRIVADILGHSAVSMTLDRYSHVSTAMQRAALEAIDDLVTDAG